MMGWLIAAVILIGLAMLPLGIVLLYNAEGFFVQAKIGFYSLMIFPAAKKEKKEKKKEPKKKSSAAPGQTATLQKKTGGKIKDFYPLIRVALEFLNNLRKKLVVKNLEMKVILAGGDPCNLAVNYGKSWAALGNLMPQLEHFLDIRKRNLQIACDFVDPEPSVYFYTHIKISLGRSLWLLIRYGIKALKEFIILKNSRKGGAPV